MIVPRFAIIVLIGILAMPSLLFRPAGDNQPAAAPLILQASASSALGSGELVRVAGGQDAMNSAKRQRVRHRDRDKEQERRDGKERAKISSPQRKGRSADECAGGALERLPETDFCTHGPDPAPPGLDVTRRVAALPAAVARAAAALPCDGDGVNGYRVQTLYVRVQGSSDQFSRYLPSIRAWTAGADEIMQESAAETGGSRRFRFVTDDCQLDVQPVALPSSAFASFGAMITALEDRGFNREDRYYLSFVDSESFGICGIATYYPDDRAGMTNYNNTGPGYSRVDAGCWDAGVTAHELMHNLGGVQRSAPHSTRNGHCIDEWDVMCYSDDEGVTMQVVCSSRSHEDRYDCGHDDYFHTNPAAGSYLATRWNTANNQFLVQESGGSEPDPDLDPDSPLVAITNPRDGARPKGKQTITVAANASDEESGVVAVEFRRCAGSICSWDAAAVLGSDSSAPFSVSFRMPKRGTITFLAQAQDDDGNTAISNPVTVRAKKR